ncbi:MAG: single-stranded DNA-binding protein [Clostridiales bacterium]|nr:single-stranded DNA-binding protein [Clostridiales bacterium]
MNKCFFIGNLTRDPELRTIPSGDSVCSFTIAVNRNRRSSAEAGQPEADFIRVTAWRQLGENCAKFLAKGRKVCVVGPISVRTYQANDGTTRASLEVQADNVEFLSSRNDAEGAPAPAASVPAGSGYVQVDEEELPF